MIDSAVALFKRRLKVAAAKTSTSFDERVAEILKQLGPGVSTKELLMGIEVEKEHGPKGPMRGIFDVTNGDMLISAKIAAAHLAEIPDYYTRLAVMEKEGKKALKAKNTLGDKDD